MMLPSHQTLCCRLDERRLERVNSLALDDLDAEGHHVDVTPDGGVLLLGRHVLGLCCIFEHVWACPMWPSCIFTFCMHVLRWQLQGISSDSFLLCKTAADRNKVAPAMSLSMPCRLRPPSCGAGG